MAERLSEEELAHFEELLRFDRPRSSAELRPLFEAIAPLLAEVREVRASQATAIAGVPPDSGVRPPQWKALFDLAAELARALERLAAAVDIPAGSILESLTRRDLAKARAAGLLK